MEWWCREPKKEALQLDLARSDSFDRLPGRVPGAGTVGYQGTSSNILVGFNVHGSQMEQRNWLSFIVHEPFFQFILLGCLIWAGVAYLRGENDRYTIHIGRAAEKRIAATYLQQFGQLPTSAQLQALIGQHVREEIFLREGLALRLDRDDEIVRRRIVQKYEFLRTDLAVPDLPTPAALEQWFEQHESRYLMPERVAFAHVYFSVDKDGEEVVKARALKLLRELRQAKALRAPNLGDAFPGPSDVGAINPEEVARLFGQSELSERLFKLGVRQWNGPFRSGYGWHLVYITGRSPAVLPPLTQVHDRVLADYMDEQRRALEARKFEELRAKYSIRIDGGAR